MFIYVGSIKWILDELSINILKNIKRINNELIQVVINLRDFLTCANLHMLRSLK